MTTKQRPFPTRIFVVLAIGWILLDAVVLGAIALIARSYPLTLNSPVVILLECLHYVIYAVIGGKLTLLCGWGLLGEGRWWVRMLSDVGVLSPLLAYIGLISPVILGGVVCFGVFVLTFIGFPYWLLRSQDFELVRQSTSADAGSRQFTVRQLMFVTLLAAIVMWLLRGAGAADMNYVVYGFLLMLLAWVYPIVATTGLLNSKWYPGGAYVAGLTAYVVALPFWTLQGRAAWQTSIAVSVFGTLVVFHLLVIRWLGYRLLRMRAALVRHAMSGENKIIQWQNGEGEKLRLSWHTLPHSD